MSGSFDPASAAAEGDAQPRELPRSQAPADPPPDPLGISAAEFLASIPWGGALPDPDTLDAATFLQWI